MVQQTKTSRTQVTGLKNKVTGSIDKYIRDTGPCNVLKIKGTALVQWINKYIQDTSSIKDDGSNPNVYNLSN